MPRAFVASLLRARAKLDPQDHVALVAHHRREWEKQQRAREVAPPLPFQDASRVEAGLRKLEAIREATGIDLLDFTPTARWIERLRLADSPRLFHQLRLLRDLFGDDDLRARVEFACADGACDTAAGSAAPDRAKQD